jgi:putative RNA 2'-phosphotransferase
MRAMMDGTRARTGRRDDPVVRTSKLVSRILRHDPASVGLRLDPGGWVAVDDLLAALQRRGHRVDRALLEHVVATNDKKRFAFDETGARIRASQGHSIGVDLGLTPVVPPAELYHGTPERTAPVIAREGIRKMGRDHVHLSPDVATATRVGARRGRPYVFVVDAAAMHSDGHVFFLSENGVWLTDQVPSGYLRPAGAGS